MAKAPAKGGAQEAAPSRRAGSKPEATPGRHARAKGGARGATVGPPLLILGLGFAAVLVSLPLLTLDGVPTHVGGYLIGSLVPILVIGLVRRADLERRQNPAYRPSPLFAPAIAVLAVAAVVVAGLHVWPIATEWAS